MDLHTDNYLRPVQVHDLQNEKKACEKALSPQNRDNSRLDRGAMTRQLLNVNKMLDEQSPPDVQDKTALSKRCTELQEKIMQGMPSQEEMRKNPPGAVGKHLRWEKQNKEDIREWKNSQLILNKGDDNPDAANIEKFRPKVSTLNMDNAQIPGQQFSFPPGPIDVKNGLSEDERIQKERHDNELLERIKVLDMKGHLTDADRAFWGLKEADLKK